jgi:hypothetical protein
MARTFGNERLEMACRRAIDSDTIDTVRVRNFLVNNREAVPANKDANPPAVVKHKNLRSSDQFLKDLKTRAIN